MKKALKEISDLLAAAAKGRTLQSRFLVGGGDWVNMDSLSYIDLNTYEYRLKPQVETVALDREDLDARCMEGKTMWVRETEGSKRCLIIRYTSVGVTLSDSSRLKDVGYWDLQKRYTWMDGTPIQKETTV